MTAAILLMAGCSSRFQSSTPKQFHLLSGKPVYLYALETLQKSALFDTIILACPESGLKQLKKKHAEGQNKALQLIAGGRTRQQSVYKALSALKKNIKYVLVHDAVRPFVSYKMLKQTLLLAQKYQAADTCIPVVDTLVFSPKGKTVQDIPQRRHFFRGQTPQAFSYPLLLKAHKHALRQGISDASDDCQLVKNLKKPVHITQGDEHNLKITTRLDLFLAEQILRLKTVNFSKFHTGRLIKQTEKHPLQGKQYIVIGATGGIGACIVSLLEKAKARVFPVSRTSCFAADLENTDSIEKILDEIYRKSGPADGLINAAGFLKVAPLKNLSRQDIERTVNINLTALIHACKSAKIKTNGHIINISSSSYAKGRAFYPVYSAAKAAVVNFTQALAEEKQDLKINVFVPCRTDTPMRRKNFPGEDKTLLLAPEKAARDIVAFLQEGNTTGSILEIKKD